jgi:hypothetical protein
VRYFKFYITVEGVGFDIFTEFNGNGCCSANTSLQVSWCDDVTLGATYRVQY